MVTANLSFQNTYGTVPEIIKDDAKVVVEDFFIKFVQDKKEAFYPEKNDLICYIINALIVLAYLVVLFLFVMSQVKNRFSNYSLPLFLEKYLKFEYGNYYGIALVVMTCLTGVFDINYTYVALLLTGMAFFLISFMKTSCSTIRWPLFISSLLIMAFVLVNFIVPSLFLKETIKKGAFYYSFLSYTMVISIAGVLLDFLLYIPYKCTPNQMILNGSGSNSETFY
jgi:hypothetical protein